MLAQELGGWVTILTDRQGSDILVLCTANICRSVMAQASLSVRLAALGAPASVHSAGILLEGEAPPSEVIRATAAWGCDVTGHRSHVVTAAELARADLVLAMAREHLRHAVVVSPETWPRAFTLKELVRRGEEVGPRIPGESVATWLDRVHAGRDRAVLLGNSLADDVADPMGGPAEAYRSAAHRLDGLISQLITLCWSGRGPSSTEA